MVPNAQGYNYPVIARNFETRLDNYFARLRATISEINTRDVAALVEAILYCQQNSTSIWIAGNGGSASTASHMAVDLMFGVESGNKIKATSLNDNSASITATGNDKSFDEVFARQIQALAKPDDLLILISASGNSKNLLRAAEAAKKVGCKVACMVGFTGGSLPKFSDVTLHIKTDDFDYGVAEDVHLALNHAIKEALNGGPVDRRGDKA